MPWELGSLLHEPKTKKVTMTMHPRMSMFIATLIAASIFASGFPAAVILS